MKEKFTDAVEAIYDRIGREGSRAPEGLALPVGRELALSLGYPGNIIDRLPLRALEGFVGAAPLPALVLDGYRGGLVADLGAGAGVDSLWLASEKIPVIPLELSRGMLSRLAENASGAQMIAPVRARLPELPLAAGSVQWVCLNGVANIIADKERLLKEARRVLGPGGRILIADVIVTGELDPALAEEGEAWAFCVGGAKSLQEWGVLLASAGFAEADLHTLEEFAPLGRGLVAATRT